MNKKVDFKSLLNSGTNFVSLPSEKRNVWLTNLTALTISSGHLFVLLFRASLGKASLEVSLVLVFNSFVILLPILINRFGYTVVSRVFVCWLSSTIILYDAIFLISHSVVAESSTYVGFRFFIIVFSCIPFLIFNSTEKKFLTLGLVIPVACLLLYDQIIAFAGYGYYAVGLNEPTYSYNTFRSFVAFLVLACSFFYLKDGLEKGEKINERLLVELDEKNKMVQRQADEDVRQLNVELKAANYQLSERVKEQSILYRTGQMLQAGGGVEDSLRDILQILPQGWQFPEIAAARINFDGLEIATSNFQSPVSTMRADIVLPRDRKGFLEIAYLEERPAQFEGPFIKEERELINMLADILEIDFAKRHESEALKRSEENLNAIINHTRVLIWSVDKDLNLVACNKPFIRYMNKTYGVDPKPGVRVLQGTSGDYFFQLEKTWTDRYTRVLKGESLVFDDAKFDIDLHCSLNPIVSHDGSITGVTTFAEDITEQKKIQKQQNLFASIVSTSNDAIFIRTEEGLIASWNEGAENIFGYAPSEIIGKPISVLLPADRQYEKDQILEKIKQGKTIHHLETVRLKKNGQSIHVSLTVSPLKDSDGSIIGTTSVVRDISERISASEKLAASERRFRALIEHSLDGISLVDSDWRPFYQSPGAERILGYTLEERVKIGTAPLIHPDDQAAFIDSRRQLIESPEVPFEFQFRMRHKNGHYVWVEGVLNNMIGDPSVNAVVANYRDITVRKEAEDRIQRHKEHLEHEVEARTRELVNEKNFTDSMVNSMPGIFYVIENERFTRWNTNFESVTGYSEVELRSLSFLDVVQDTDEKFALSQIRSTMEKGSSSFEMSILAKGGKLVPYYFSLVLAEIESQKLIVATATDISALKEAQETLKLHDERMELAFSTSGNSWWDLDIQSRKVVSHPNRYLTLGYSFEDVGQTSDWWIQIIHPDDRERASSQMDEYIMGNSFIYDEQFRVRSKQGDWRWVRVLGKVVTRDKKGQPLRMIGTADNITKSKEIEQQLTEARSAAELANRAKGHFLANMSHEIRTPLNAVIGLSHLAMKTDLTTKQADYLQKIQSSSESLLGIINDILDFSKIDSGKLKLEEVPFDLEDVLHKLADVITYRAHSKNLEIVFGVDNDVPVHLVGDPIRLQQVLNNLCSNAVKFTEHGEVVVTTTLVNQVDDSVKLQFEVTDTGIGMDEEQQKKLFTPFEQADNSISRKYGGTGLGLSIIKLLVELMRGEVWLTSVPDKGSTFYFTAWFGRQPDSRTVPIPAKHERLKILVVDDNKSSSAILRKALESFAFEVTETDSGLDAIHYLKKCDPANPFKLVIMDWNMPQMDGLKAAEIIKQDTRLRTIPIIMMCSSYANDELYQKVDELGLSGVLIKPIKYSALYDSIMDSIHDRRGKKAVIRKAAAIKEETLLEQGHVLLVEDNEINRQVATELLSGYGYSVEIAVNGLEAVQKVENSGVPSMFDIVLMDLQMPILGGYQATIEIRKLPAYKTLPIVAMTADAMEGVREKCLEVGMMDFITKPINPPNMLAVIKKWAKPRGDQEFRKQKPAAPQPALTISNIDGIDLQEGLGRVNGNVKLYMELLARFFDDHKNFAEVLSKMVLGGDHAGARRLIHTLKGTSSSLGMLKLHRVVVDVEQKTNGSAFPSDTEGALQALIQEVAIIQDGLSKALVQSANSAKQVSLKEVKPLLIQLDELLRKGDSEAISIMKKIGDVKGHQNEIDRIRLAVKEYDFDKARIILKDIALK